jgi:hypothetical protein
MPKFSVPAFVITDLLTRSRKVGRRAALMDSVVAGAAGSVTLGIILGALSKPRQRATGPIAPVLTAVPTIVNEASVVVLTWTATPGTSITYSVNRSVGSGKASKAVNDEPLTSPGWEDEFDGVNVPANTQVTYTVDVFSGSGSTPIVSSAPVTVTPLAAP